MNRYGEIIAYGRKVVERELATSFFGNISMRSGDELLITGTGTMLDELEISDLVVCPVAGAGERDKTASSELVVHRAIYQSVAADAVLHTHSMYSVLAATQMGDVVSMTAGELLPFLMHVPVVSGHSGSVELAENVAAGLQKNPVVIVKDHGVFAAGKTLKECYVYISSLEYYSKDYILRRLLQVGEK